jgi:hypothetical protein
MNQNSSLLKIEVLENEFNLLIMEYEQAYQNYLNIQNSNSPYNYIQNRVLLGGVVLLDSSSSDVSGCMALCSSNTSCSGANYNSSSQSCILKSGLLQASITNNSDDYAIITQTSQTTNVLRELSKQLNETLRILTEEVNNIIPTNQEEQEQKNIKIEQLYIKSQMLNYDRKQIEIMIDENNQLENQYNISTLNVKQNNLNFMLWVILAIVILITGIKFVVYS